jgi:glucosamine--fructose-6-phosphate aminotransferase (isomerizing)
MCGIVAYIGQRDAASLIIKGLKRLEYRGYDSSGIAILNENGLGVFKKKGKVIDLENVLDKGLILANIGIGHTRWATHGEPNDVNAHPHKSNSGRFAIVHNGIIENYSSIKQILINKDYVFHSQTDTEVLVNFIEEIQKSKKCHLPEAVRIALKEVVGAYAIVVLDAENPNQLVAARKGSPLVIGIGKGEYFFASDATPIIEYTKEVVYLDDLEIAVVNAEGLTVKNLQNEQQDPYIQTVELELAAIGKGGYDHFMLKEIFEQTKSIADCLRGRVNAE